MVFYGMEMEVRSHIKDSKTGDKEKVIKAIIDNEDVNFHWSLLAANWEPEETAVLLNMMAEQWITLRGFSHASAFIERYKQRNKKGTQKSKGLRKNLIGSTSSSIDNS